MPRAARPRAPALPRGIRTPQQARSRRTRERILAAAVAAFEAGGYDETTTAAIARRAGIGVGRSTPGSGQARAAPRAARRHGAEIADHVVLALSPSAGARACRASTSAPSSRRCSARA
jgi:hypothetical protein